MIDDYSIVEITVDNAIYGLYLTPDMKFFANFIQHEELKKSIQEIVHNKQPTAASYLAFSNHIYDEANKWLDNPEWFILPLMAILTGFKTTKAQMDLCVESMLAVVTATYLEWIDVKDSGIYPRIIPPEIADIIESTQRYGDAWHNTHEIFYRILATDPWLTYVARLREQYERAKKFFTDNKDVSKETVEYYSFTRNDFEQASSKYLTNNRKFQDNEAKRALRRAVKLCEKIGFEKELKVFLTGLPLRICGQYYDYTITGNNESLFNRTLKRNVQIAPVNMKIIDKKQNFLGECCLYFEDTSIIDHLVNLRLYTQNRDAELEMLQAAHMTTAATKFYSDPLLPDLKDLHDPLNAPPSMIASIMRHNNDKVQKEVFESLGFMTYTARQALLKVSGLPNNFLSIVNRAEKQCVDIFAFMDRKDEICSFISEVETVMR